MDCIIFPHSFPSLYPGPLPYDVAVLPTRGRVYFPAPLVLDLVVWLALPIEMWAEEAEY